MIFIGLAAFAYNSLKNKVASPNRLPEPEKITQEDSKTDETADSSKTENDKPTDSSSDGAAEDEKTMAPDVTVFDSEGNEVALSSLFGKPIVMNFWASWCPPCKEEMPHFNKVYEEMKEDITFVMIDVVDGQRETMENGKKHIKDNAYTFPVYYDNNQDAAYTYGTRSLPTSYFLDKDGYIITGAEGAIDEDTLRKGIEMIK